MGKKKEKTNRITLSLVTTTCVLILSSFQYGYGISELNGAEFFMPYFTHGDNDYPSTVIFTHEGNNKTCNHMHSFFKDCIPMKNEGDWSLCVSIFAIGGLVGALIGGPTSTLIGRKWGLFLTTFVFGIDYVLKSLFSNFYTLLFGRILHGVGAGWSTMIVPMYITEIAPRKYRGAFATLHQLSIVIGIFMSQFVSIFVAKGQLWRILMAWPISLSLIQFIWIPLHLPESPQWLVSKKKIEKAKEVLMDLRGYWYRGKNKKLSAEVEEELNLLIRECKKREDDKKKEKEEDDFEKSEPKDEFKFGCWRFTYHLLLACFILVCLPFFFSFSNSILLWYSQFNNLFRWCKLCFILFNSYVLQKVNAIAFYSTKVFAIVFPSTGALPVILSTISMFFNVVSVIPAIFLVEIVGRKFLLLFGMIADMLCMLFVTVFQVIMEYAFSSSSDPGSITFGVLTIISVTLFRIFFQFSLGPIPWFITSELFPTKYRGITNGITMTVSWFLIFLVGLLFPVMQRLMSMYCFLVFSGALLISWGFIYLFLMETKGKSIEEISKSRFRDHLCFLSESIGPIGEIICKKSRRKGEEKEKEEEEGISLLHMKDEV